METTAYFRNDVMVKRPYIKTEWLLLEPIKLRFLWTMAAPDVPRWEQAFSSDGGATWETNWVMTCTHAG